MCILEVDDMCTAIAYHTNDHYFGRNLDVEACFNETITITPRNVPLTFRRKPTMQKHYAMIGIAYVLDEYPLYYDAVNEKGLGVAGLRFAGYADYQVYTGGKDEITPYELIPWILGQCACVQQAKKLLADLQLIDLPFREDLPPSPLHWMISDQHSSIVLESCSDGLHIYDDPVNVLTNNPPFPYHLIHLNDFMQISPQEPCNQFARRLNLKTYCLGMGAMGLPGDCSSASRFVRAAFAVQNAVCDGTEEQSVSQFFHILQSVSQIRGCVYTADGQCETTAYSCCCNLDRGIYYYTTYDNTCVTAVDLHRENLDGTALVSWPLVKKQKIVFQNK